MGFDQMEPLPGDMMSRREPALMEIDGDRVSDGFLRRAWKKVAGIFKGTPAPMDPVDTFVARQDVKVFTDEFDRRGNTPIHAARMDGGRALPRPDDTADPEFVAMLLARAQQHSTALVAAGEKTANALGEAINDRGPNLAAAINAIAREVMEVAIPNLEGVFTDKAVKAMVVKEAALTALNKFRHINGLEDETPADPIPPFRFVVIALIALIFEGAVNGFMLQDATDGGFRGAAMWGLLPSVLNLSLGFFAGWACRWRLARNLPARIVGWLATLFAVACCVLLACLAGTWRAQAQNGDLSAALQGIFTGFFAHPVAWANDFAGLAIALFGMLTFAVAFYHGQSFTGHPYPGFSVRWWNVRDKEENLNEILDDFSNGTQQFIEDAGNKVKDKQKEAERHWAAHRRNFVLLGRLDRAVREKLSLLTVEANRLRHVYVATNMRIRGATPMPPRLLKNVLLSHPWAGCAPPADDPIGQWLEERVRETADAGLVAQTDMIKARVGAIERLRQRIQDSPGVAPPDLPSAPLPNLDDRVPYIYGPFKRSDQP